MNQLQVIVQENNLEPTKANAILEQFIGYFEEASEWEAKAKEIVVTDASQTEEMATAKEGRLFLRDKRIDIEKTRKALKEQSLREGKAIDGISNVLKALIIPIENHLKAQEDFIEIKAQEAATIERKKLEREADEKRAKEEAVAKKEQEQLREENEKLRKQAVARDAKEKIARDKAKIKLDTERKVAIEKQRIIEQAAAADRKKAAEKQKKINDKIKAEKEKSRKIKADAAEREAKLKAKLAATVQCPRCNHKFIPKG